MNMQTSFLSKLSGHEEEQVENSVPDGPKYIVTPRVYQHWPGTHQFFMKGKIMGGPFRDNFVYFLFVMALLGHALLFTFVLVPEVEPSFHTYLLSIYWIFFGLTMIFYFLTSFTEPGLIPTKKFLNVASTVNKENQEIQKLGLLTKYLKGFYSSVLTLHWQRQWENESEESLSHMSRVKLKDVKLMKKSIEDIEEVDEDNIGAEFGDNREYHDDVLTYKSEDKREHEQEAQPKQDESEKEQDAVVDDVDNMNDINDNKEVEAANQIIPNPNDDSFTCQHLNPKNLKSDKNWLLEEYHSKFCLHCEVYKTKNAEHCKDCNSCVRVRNHHSVFVNNCIGKRNYKHFISLIICLLFLNVYFIATLFMALPHLMLVDMNLYRTFMVLVFLQSVLVSGYCFFHLFLFISFVINGEDPSVVKPHSPMRAFLFDKLKVLKTKINNQLKSKKFKSVLGDDSDVNEKSGECSLNNRMNNSRPSTLFFNSNLSLNVNEKKSQLSAKDLIKLTEHNEMNQVEMPMITTTNRDVVNIDQPEVIQITAHNESTKKLVDSKVTKPSESSDNSTKENKSIFSEKSIKKKELLNKPILSSKQVSNENDEKIMMTNWEPLAHAPNKRSLTASETSPSLPVMFPKLFQNNSKINESMNKSEINRILDEHELMVFNDKLTLDRLENELKPMELLLLEKEENYDLFEVSPSLINFYQELDINEANELAITRRIYMN